jgi:Lon protease-like protein
MPMSELPQPDTLFLDASKVRFLLTASEPSDDIPHMDIDLEEGDLRSQATLAYDFTKALSVSPKRKTECLT